MYVFEPISIDGELAEERFHEQACDKEEYDRIFKFKPATKLIKSKKVFTESPYVLSE